MYAHGRTSWNGGWFDASMEGCCFFRDEYVDRATWMAADVPFIDGLANPRGYMNLH